MKSVTEQEVEIWLPTTPFPLSEGRRSWLLANGFQSVKIAYGKLWGLSDDASTLSAAKPSKDSE
jgi:hypothetical protein